MPLAPLRAPIGRKPLRESRGMLPHKMFEIYLLEMQFGAFKAG